MGRENEKRPNLLVTLLCSKFKPKGTELSKSQVVSPLYSPKIDRLIKKIDEELEKLRE